MSALARGLQITPHTVPMGSAQKYYSAYGECTIWLVVRIALIIFAGNVMVDPEIATNKVQDRKKEIVKSTKDNKRYFWQNFRSC